MVNYLNDAVIRGEMVVQAVKFQKAFAEDNLLSSEVLRGAINQTMRSAVEHAEHILAGYAVYLPDALDAEDANYVGSTNLGSQRQWPCSPVLTCNAKGELTLETIDEKELKDTSLERSRHSFHRMVPVQSAPQTELSVDPYVDETRTPPELMTSVTFPILEQDVSLGIVGLDIELAHLQDLVKTMDQRMFDGAGEVLLVSQHGVIAGTTQPKLKLGAGLQQLDLTLFSALQGMLKTDKRANQLGLRLPAGLYAHPICKAAKPLCLADHHACNHRIAHATLLAEKLSGELGGTTLQLVGSAFAVGLLGLLIFWFVARQISTPLRQKVADRLREILPRVAWI